MSGVLQNFLEQNTMISVCSIQLQGEMAIYAFKGKYAKIYIANSTGVSLNAVFDNIYFPVTELKLIIVIRKLEPPNQRKFYKSRINNSNPFNSQISYNLFLTTNLTIRAIYV